MEIRVNIFMDDFCLERRSALKRCADESKLGHILATEENLNVRQEKMDGFWEQNKGKVMKYNSASFKTVHNRNIFFFFSCELGVLSWK